MTETTTEIQAVEPGTVAPVAQETAAPARLYAALAKAQAGFGKIVKNRVNPAFHSHYADLQAIIDATRPALNAAGIYCYQDIENTGDDVTVHTILLHSSGETLTGGRITIKLGAGSNPAQRMGSALTYARRYSLSAVLGVSADDDDDGNAVADATSKSASKPVSNDPRSPAVLATINACRTKQQVEHLRSGMSPGDQELYRPDLAAAWKRLPGEQRES